MQREYFGEKLTVMRKAYNNAYSDVVAQEIWECVKHISEERFTKVLKRLFAANPRKPFGIKEIEAMLLEIKNEVYEIDKARRSEEYRKCKFLNQDEISKGIGEIIKKFGG